MLCCVVLCCVVLCCVVLCCVVLCCVEQPYAFISITLTTKEREFTNSLNDPNFGDYQTLSRQVRSNVSSPW